MCFFVYRRQARSGKVLLGRFTHKSLAPAVPNWTEEMYYQSSIDNLLATKSDIYLVARLNTLIMKLSIILPLYQIFPLHSQQGLLHCYSAPFSARTGTQ